MLANEIFLTDFIGRHAAAVYQAEFIEESKPITGIAQSVDQLADGYLFVALQGSRHHGLEFAKDAGKHKILGVMVDSKDRQLFETKYASLYQNTPIIFIDNLLTKLGKLSAEIFHQPSKKIKLIGLTGTAGKTSVTTIIYNSLLAAEKKAGLIGSNYIKIGNFTYPTKLTTPQPTDLQNILNRMSNQGIEYVVMEVSSHAISLGRINGSSFYLAAFTNLSQDHLDFHTSMEEYYQTKKRLFTSNNDFSVNKVVVSTFDKWGLRLSKEIAKEPITLGYADTSPFWWVNEEETSLTGSTFSLQNIDNLKLSITTNLTGEFNIRNTALAVTILSELEIPFDKYSKQLNKLLIPGRMQSINLGQNYQIFIDYAHKPGSLEQVLLTLQKQKLNRLITVVGAGGDRDQTKRKIMGNIAAKYSDLVVITDDNPRSEDPAKIREQLLIGVKQQITENANEEQISVLEIGDRKQAIQQALEIASLGDIVLIAGKGQETGQEISGKVIDFSDEAVVREFLKPTASNMDL